MGAIVGRGSVMGQLPAFNRLAELARSVASVKITDGPVSCGCVVVTYVKWYAIPCTRL